MCWQVVPDSGRGWQLVELVKRQGEQEWEGAELRATEEFDYEHPEHKDGLRFQVQVTDQVR